MIMRGSLRPPSSTYPAGPPAQPVQGFPRVPAGRVAVIRFTGRWSPANLQRHEAALRRWAQAHHLTIAGDAEVNRYDPPFKPWFLRRNEIWLPLANA